MLRRWERRDRRERAEVPHLFLRVGEIGKFERLFLAHFVEWVPGTRLTLEMEHKVGPLAGRENERAAVQRLQRDRAPVERREHRGMIGKRELQDARVRRVGEPQPYAFAAGDSDLRP